MSAVLNSARLEARLPANVHSMLKRAADLEGRSLTDFVVSAAHAAAQKSIENAELLRLSAVDQEVFAKVLIQGRCAARKMFTVVLRLIWHNQE